jgi:hypothetical protein
MTPPRFDAVIMLNCDFVIWLFDFGCSIEDFLDPRRPYVRFTRGLAPGPSF